MSHRLNVEPLEDRNLLSPLGDLLSLLNLGPLTALHYANGGNFAHGAYNAPGDPGSMGFNLVDINSPDTLSHIPAGDKALVVIDGVPGLTPDFINTIKPYLNNPKVFGFYLADEPNPANVSAATIKAESDWIHANFPGAKTFMVLPNFCLGYTPANTGVDYVGLDPYPIRTWGEHYEYIPIDVLFAEFNGWSRDQIIPVYQAFGNTGSFVAPTQEQEQMILAIWGFLTPHPAFDYAYSWGEAWGSQALVDRPDWQGVFQIHNTQPPLGPLVSMLEKLGYRA